MWSKKFLATASRRGYKDVLTGKVTLPDALKAEKDWTTEDKSAMKLNEMAYSDLLLSCSDELSFSIVDSSQYDDSGTGNSRIAWQRLHARFEPKTGASKVQLKALFTKCQLKSVDTDPEEWIVELETIQRKLGTMKSIISEDDMLVHILNNMPPEYEGIVETSEERLNDGTLTLESLRLVLRTKYLRMQRYNKSQGDDHEVGLYAKQFKGKCRVCGKVGHKGDDCWTLDTNKDKKPKVGSKLNKSNKKKDSDPKEWHKTAICHECNEKGHIRPNCPKVKKTGAEKIEKETAMTVTEDTAEIVLMAQTQAGMCSPNIWIGDTGASCHMTRSLVGMSNLRNTNHTVTIGNGRTVTAGKMGTWRGIIVQEDGSTMNITLKDVAYVPTLHVNLFSITQAMKNQAMISNRGKFIVIKKEKLVFTFDKIFETRLGFVGGVEIKPHQSENSVAFLTTDTFMTYEDAHDLLGHAGEAVTKLTAKFMGWTISKKKETCESCPIAKAKQKNMAKQITNVVTEAGTMMSSDMSSVAGSSFGGSKYWILIVDYATKMKWSFFVKQKSEQAQTLLNFVKELKANHNINIKRWRFDNAGENKMTEELFRNNNMGIEFEYTARETPQQNGVVERAFGTLYGRVRAMLNAAGLPKYMREGVWTECANTATKLDNILVNGTGGVTPYMQLYGKSPGYETNLRKFGEIGIVTKTNMTKVRSKLEDRGEPCMFIGYADKHAGNVYRMLNLRTNRVWVTRDIIWLTKMYGEYKGLTKKNVTSLDDPKYVINQLGNDTTLTHPEGRFLQHVRFADDNDEVNNEMNNVDERDNNEIGVVLDNDEVNTTSDEEEEYTKDKFRLTRELKGLRTYNMPGEKELAEFVFHTVVENGKDDEPERFKEAWYHEELTERGKWRNAIKKEFGDMIRRGVWKRVNKCDVPEGKKLLGTKWVFKKKKNGVYRTRLVALGYSQVPGVDFFDNFAPVVNDVTFRVMMIMKAVNEWHGEIIDVETAFLYGDLEETIYMKNPEGLEEYEGKSDSEGCLMLCKAIYGLVQAARAWWKKFISSLKELNFVNCPVEGCLVLRKTQHGTVIFCIYVDDVMCIGDEGAVKLAILEIQKLYSIKMIGSIQEYVGVTIEEKMNKTVLLSQPDTIKKLSIKFQEELNHVRSSKTPTVAREVVMRPMADKERIGLDLQDRFRSGVGMLLWLTKHSRPDIANAVREASKVMDGATEAHYKYMLKIIKYVVETKTRKLKLQPEVIKQGEWYLKAFSDSDYSGDKDTRKSVSGFMIYLMGAPVAWRSRSQKSVTLSSTEAEYVAVSEVATEIIFVRNLLEFLGIRIVYPIILFVDNIGAIYLAEQSGSSTRTKHVDTRYHFVREYIEQGVVKIVFVRSEDNVSDPFTKNLSVNHFEKHIKKFMHDDVGDTV